MIPFEFAPCACMGPQLGQPYCPCEMQRRGLSDGSEYAWSEEEKTRLKDAIKQLKELAENKNNGT